MSELPEGWVETTLGEVCCKIGSGATPRGGNEVYKNHGISLIRSQNILDFDFSYNGLAFIDDSQAFKLKNVEVVGGDVLINITGDSVARVCKVPEGVLPARVNQHVAILRTDNKKLKSGYLKYYLLNPIFKRHLLALANSGGTRNALTKNMLELLEVNLPPLPEQKAIATVLSAFDDKIVLLREQNRTLETLAQTIFKEWFVNFNLPDQNGKPYRDNGGEMVDSELGEIPKGWRVERLGEVAKTNVSSINKNTKLDIIQYLDTGSITEGHIESIQELQLVDAPSRAKRIVQHNDILISTVRPNLKHYGLLKEPEDNLIVSTGFCVITCDEIDPHFVYYLLTANDMTDYLHSVAEGSTSTYPSIKPSDIEKIEFVLPSENIVQLFSGVADKAWNKIVFNQKQIQTLSKTRDTLLPKLMSGAIRVKGFEK